MANTSANAEKHPRHRFLRLVFILWLAVLAFGLPEVFAGTGRLWIIRADVYILALPLYALHFLLLTHIAVRTQRISWPALYLFGVLFGLYETWITKVVWHGYPGENGFAMGSIGHWFGIHETLGLVLFYHPVTSFLLPLAVVSRLFPAFGAAFPTPDWVFGRTKAAFLRRLGLLLIWGILTGHNLKQPEVVLLTWLPMLILLWLGYLLLKIKGVAGENTPKARIVARPLLGRMGIFITVFWLLLMYLITYARLLPEWLPPPYIQLITLGFYPLLFLLLRRTPKGLHEGHEAVSHPARLPARWLISVFLLGLLVTVLMPLGAQVRTGLAILPFLSMVPLGVALFLWLVVWRVGLRRKRR